MEANEPRAGLADDLVATGAGDKSAFHRLYRTTAPRLLAICMRVTRDRPAAEDVLQGVYVKIWQSAGRFDRTRSKPMAWLGSIARNAAIDWYRAQRHRHEDSDRGLDAVPAASEPVDARIIREEGEELAMGFVHALDEELESQVRRIYLEGMTYEEAAETDGVPIGTLKSRVRRALLAIREKLVDD